MFSQVKRQKILRNTKKPRPQTIYKKEERKSPITDASDCPKENQKTGSLQLSSKKKRVKSHRVAFDAKPKQAIAEKLLEWH